MATTHADVDRRTDSRAGNGDDTKVRHSKEDAVDNLTFEYLAEATYQMDEYWGLQCRFVLFVAGRLGLRSGEISHMDESWVDFDRERIIIPRHDPCTGERQGSGPCGQCKQNARQMARVRSENNYADVHADLGGEDELEPGAGKAQRSLVAPREMYHSTWSPKTEAAAREVPFDSLPRAAITIRDFFDRYDEYPCSLR